MKQYYFISGLPRSGSTLLSAILRQNPEFYADIGSPIEEIIRHTIGTIGAYEGRCTFSETRRIKLLHSIFDGYYDHINKSVIFDSCRKWTSKTSLLKSLFPNTKILCTVRDIASILNSFEMIHSKNPYDTYLLAENTKSVFSRCDDMMDHNGGIVAEPWIFLQEGYALNPEMIYLIEYEDLCKYPEETMKKIYEFIDKPYFNHDFENVEYSNKDFDKLLNLNDLHTVRKKVEYKPTKFRIPPEVIKKYNQMEFWREDNKNPIENFKYN